MRVLYILLWLSIFWSCKKNSGVGSNNLKNGESRFIMKTDQLCSGSRFIGYKKAPNLIGYMITNTHSDTLNSWYTREYGPGFIVYAKRGSNFILWKDGADVFSNIGTHYALELVEMSAIPYDLPIEHIFKFTPKGNGAFLISSKLKNHIVVALRGGPKGTTICDWESYLFLSDGNSCFDVIINVPYTICLMDKIFLEEIK